MTSINEFYNLQSVYEKHLELSQGTRIFNLDETGLTNVQIPQKVLAGKETRRLNQATNTEWGTLVTACCIVAANGSYLLPILVFPQIKYKQHMINDAPAATLGLANKTG